MRIRCAKCDKPVDRIEVWEHSPHQMRRSVVAYCHGETDEMHLTMDFLAGLDADEKRRFKASEGIAFATDRIVAA